MKVARRLEDIGDGPDPIVLAVGFFDGVHLGHQAVLARAREEARREGGRAWALTFDPHPLKVIRPESAPLMITSTPHKLRVIESLGLDGCVVLEFTPELRLREPAEFIESLCDAVAGLKQIVVGPNWTFGHGRRGSAELLRELAASRGIAVSVVPPVLQGGSPVSSTRVRHAIRHGRLDEAAALLGRPFSVWGDVVAGDRIGRGLGFPTANIDPHNEVHLPDGVYAARAAVAGRRCDAAAYIGKRPTFPAPAREWVVEVYLLDADLDLYGREIEVSFVARLRADRRFAGPEELKAQIARDVEETRRILASTAR